MQRTKHKTSKDAKFSDSDEVTGLNNLSILTSFPEEDAV